MTPLLLIGATVVAFAAGVYFGRRSLAWADLYDVPYGDFGPRSIDGEAIDFRNDHERSRP